MMDNISLLLNDIDIHLDGCDLRNEMSSIYRIWMLSYSMMDYLVVMVVVMMLTVVKIICCDNVMVICYDENM
jgi:hypothetical protein